MKFYLLVLIFQMQDRKLTLLWQDKIEQQSLEQCMENAQKYKYAVEAVNNVEVQYFCRGR
jgi:hypothetical protein